MSEANGDDLSASTSEIDLCREVDYWRQHAAELQALISRLTVRLRGRDRRLRLLESAVSRTLVMHHVWASHLERRVERLPARDIANVAVHMTRTLDEKMGVVAYPPYTTRTLRALFEVMHEHWSEWDPDRPPKSSTVARAIDEKLGLKGQANGEASRSAQTFAAAIRPDSVSEADGRHR